MTQKHGETMEQASEALNFERAAQYRDQLAKLKNVQSQQIVARTSGDFDAVASPRITASRASRSCSSGAGARSAAATTFRGPEGREGRGGGRRDLRAFLLQYYGGREAPKEILVSRSVPEAAGLAEMLSAQSGHKVAISRASGATGRAGSRWP